MTANSKQRLTLLTKAEKLAAVTGGALDENIPANLIRKRLRDEARVTFDTDALLPAIASRVAWCRGLQVPGGKGQPAKAKRMEPTEIASQAADTCAVIDELMTRLDKLHPDLRAHADELLWRAGGEFVHTLRDRIQPDVYRLRAAIEQARLTVVDAGSKRGPKASAWTTARDGLAGDLHQHSQPVLAAKAAKALAVDLLELCGQSSPRGA